MRGLSAGCMCDLALRRSPKIRVLKTVVATLRGLAVEKLDKLTSSDSLCVTDVENEDGHSACGLVCLD